MAKVLFAVNWFGPDKKRYRKSVDRYDYREVPDEFLKHLPKSAKVISKPEARPAEAAPEKLTDHDAARAAEDAHKRAEEQADESPDYAELMARRRRDGKRGKAA